jgi:Tat protein secretion system quality control protein TatD with DNase activity
MVALRLLPFDAHNHIQLGPPPPSPLSPSSDLLRQQLLEATSSALSEIDKKDINDENEDADAQTDNVTARQSFLVRSLGEYIRYELKGKHLSGMALMATHPRDFATLLDLEREVQNQTPVVIKQSMDGDNNNDNNNDNDDIVTTTEEITILPCLGVHPWFLHELDPEDDWAMVPSTSSFEQHEHVEGESSKNNHAAMPVTVPNWIANLESLLSEHPHLPVGEIGLDNFHFDPITQELTSTMDKQVEALKLQLGVATRLHRPVSLHCVRAMGRLMDALEEVAEENYQRLSKKWNNDSESSANFRSDEDDNKDERKLDKKNVVRNHILPPRLYFHAFGGKAATATQLIKTLETPRRIKIRNESVTRRTKKKFVSIVPTKVYFGFAPPVNFRSPKTASVIKAVGLERLVLETDREDVRNIGPDMEAGIVWISEVLGITEEELVLVTNENARDLYGCCGAGVKGH